jgi:molybdate transport system regulatory protein
MPSRRRLVGKLAFETAAGTVFGDKRIRLLEAIAEHGSLNRAARAVPLSYKAAWDALDAMNNLAEAPLVVRTTGGRNGGGTRLTEHGLRMVALYRAMESSQQEMLDRLSSPRALAAAADEGAPLRTLLRRMSVRTSARNQFAGTVAAIEDAGGMRDVRVALQGGEELVASITPESVETLELAPGGAVHALIKAPSVDITASAPRRRGSHNVFAGRISALEPGSARTRVTLTTATGRTLAAALAPALCERRSLAVGDPAHAVFATESVILATYA